jgi:tRNA nucleotidyltransferase (CCA-adding enzyme)
MIESGWGQIPVVEDERIVGVVTRTDLITLWGTPPTTTPQPDVIALLKSGISPPVLALVRHISRVADEMGLVPYFVGGLVRDLLLGQQVFDIDMVIEGEAIKLAKHLVDSLGGEIRTHRRFGTAKWFLTPEVWRAVGESADEEDLPATIDFVTARTEFYTYPTALPQIEHSSIKQDLHRRDFTINTLAIRLDPEHWGQLLDFYGGRADLQEGQIRVLHSLSFVDDPTRMLRAVRLETRLGFSLEPRTRELIADGLPLLKRVSGDRIRHELALIFREEEPEKVLRRLGELDILHHIHPQLCCDEWVVRKYEALRTRLDPEVWQLEDEDDFFLHVALLAYRMEPAVIQTLCTRLKMPRDDSEDLEMLHALQESFAQLGKARRPSFVYRLLEPYAARVLAVAWLATDRRAIKNRLWRYQTEWRLAEPAISGADLKEMGLRPGPLFGRLLRTLRDACLDGRVSTLAEEQALLQTLLAQEREEK